MPEHPQASAIVMIGRWRADPRADEIEADGVVVKLEPLKMRLLMALAERPGEVVLTQELLDTVWSGLVVTSSSVYQGIAQLRRVLDGEDLPAYIETVPRKGYRLVAPVQHLPRAGAPPAVTPAPAIPEVPAPALRDEPVLDVPAVDLPAADVPIELQSPARRRWLLGITAAGGAGAAGAALWHYVDSLPPPTPVRIAVLPFADHSKGAAEPALSQGLALDVIRALERFPQVDVVAAESALVVGYGDNGIAHAVQRLQVGFVLLGELVRAGARVQIAVRLLALPSERVRWRREFEQAIDGVSLLPQVIASEAAAALHLALPQRPPIRAAGPTEAYELYVLGQHAWRAKTPEAFAKARDYYERGIEIDPAYAPNYVGLGWTWIGRMTNGGGFDWREAYARAAPLFDKALRLDPDSAEALTAQGVMRSQAARYDEARTLFERARQLNPGYAQVHHSYGVAEFDDGWPQRSIAHFRRAAELNPLSLSPVERLGFSQVTAGQLQDAERAYRRAIELEPQHPNGHWGLGILAYARGTLDNAVLNYREALRLEARRPFLWGELAWFYLDLGLPDLAAEAFGRATALLPKSRWPRIDAVYAWIARPEHGPPPDDLALTAQQVPEDASAIDVMLLRAMAGLPLDEPLLQRALSAQQALSVPLQQALWFVFQGHNSLLDLAAVYTAMGRPERARPHLDEAQAQLDRYQRQGNVWHALHFHRARLQSLRGDKDGALAALGAAVDAGCRRGWWLRLDPAFAGLREEARFKTALARIDADTARQRALLKA